MVVFLDAEPTVFKIAQLIKSIPRLLMVTCDVAIAFIGNTTQKRRKAW
jgi:hypothetical protein